MDVRRVAKEILETAVYAPSGDNSQPWRFKLTGETIAIYNLPDRDATLYNFRQRGSYLGHGALIENITIAAEHHGFATDIELFPGEPGCVALVTLRRDTPRVVHLLDAVKKRATNRKPYKKEPVKPYILGEIANSIREFPVQLKFVEKKSEIQELAKAISTNERVLMENRQLHDFLFSMIRWSKKEEEERPGLYIKTMEFPPPVQLLMRYVVKYWGALEYLNMIGFSRMIPKQSGAGYAASGAIGAIVIEGDDNETYVQAGRAFQRVWLVATLRGLSMQPVTAIPYLAARLEAGEGDMFTAEHKDFIRQADSAMNRIFSLGTGERIAMLFRIGIGKPPTAHSHKLPPVIEFA